MKETDIVERVASEAAIGKQAGLAVAGTMFSCIAETRRARAFPPSGSAGLADRTNRLARAGTGERTAAEPPAGISFETGKPPKGTLAKRRLTLRLSPLTGMWRLTT